MSGLTIVVPRLSIAWKILRRATATGLAVASPIYCAGCGSDSSEPSSTATSTATPAAVAIATLRGPLTKRPAPA